MHVCMYVRRMYVCNYFKYMRCCTHLVLADAVVGEPRGEVERVSGF